MEKSSINNKAETVIQSLAEEAIEGNVDSAREFSACSPNSPIPQLDVEVKDVDSENESPDSETKDDDIEDDSDMVNKVIIDRVSKIRLEKHLIQDEIETKFKEIGVIIRKLNFLGNIDRYFEACIADISPVSLKKIWGRRLGISNCSIISYYPMQ